MARRATSCNRSRLPLATTFALTLVILLSLQARGAGAIVQPSNHQDYKFDYLRRSPIPDPVGRGIWPPLAKRDNPIPLIVTNNCGDTLWPGIATQGGDGPESGGFELAPGATRSLTVGPTWSGRVWGRTNCTVSNDTATCQTGDCFGKLECEYGVSYTAPLRSCSLSS
jgi:hypothetical protein